MVVRVFNDVEIEFLAGLALAGADNPTVLGSFRDLFPSNVTTDSQLIYKYRLIGRTIDKTAQRTYCSSCGRQVYLLGSEVRCSDCD